MLEPPLNPVEFLERNASANPGGVFTRSAGQTVTNAEAVVSVKKLAFELRRLGVTPGDVVALDLPDQLSILFTEAVYHEGGISTVLPPGYRADGVFAIDWVFARAEPTPQGDARIVLVDARFLRRAEEIPTRSRSVGGHCSRSMMRSRPGSGAIHSSCSWTRERPKGSTDFTIWGAHSLAI